MKQIRRENQLVSLFLRKGHLSFRTYTTSLVEVVTPSGIADIVLLRQIDSGSPSTLRRVVQPRWFFALRELPYRRIFSAEDLAQLAGVSIGRARDAANEFVDAGYCEKVGSNRWRKFRQPKPITNRLCAIEAKLSDWQRALLQASRNYDFANESWVLLDHSRSTPAIAALPEFVRRNVGLATMSVAGEISIHFRPVQSKPRSTQRSWHVQGEIIRRLRPIQSV